jgi:hypothetical protein
MGKSDAPAPPDYKGQALATGNSAKYNEVGPAGSVNWTIREGADPNNPQPGDYIRSTTLSPEQQSLYDQTTATQLQAGQAGQAALGELGNGRQQVQDALYRRATQYYDQNFGDQEDSLRTRLANQGLVAGSEAYDKELRNFRQTKDTAYGDATDRAITGADQSQNSAVSRLASLLSLSRGQNPSSANGAGGTGVDYAGAANQQYGAQVGQVNAQNAQAAQTNSDVISAIGTALWAY